MTRIALALIALPLAVAAAPAAAQDADTVVATARQAATENRHADAIAAYRQAIALAPARRGEWLVALADQLTWSQQLPEASAATSASTPPPSASASR
jgi:hypothetical protein